MKSGWKAIDDMGIEIDDETREMTLENAIKFVRFYGINAVSKFSDNMLQLFGNEALRVIGKAFEDGYTLLKRDVNSDLISRQDVLALAKDVTLINGAKHRCIDSTQIHELPSAEPQIIPCKDCKHRVVNEHYGEKGYFKLKAYCVLDTGDIFELGRCAEEDDWFCADAERRTE